MMLAAQSYPYRNPAPWLHRSAGLTLVLCAHAAVLVTGLWYSQAESAPALQAISVSLLSQPPAPLPVAPPTPAAPVSRPAAAEAAPRPPAPTRLITRQALLPASTEQVTAQPDPRPVEPELPANVPEAAPAPAAAAPAAAAEPVEAPSPVETPARFDAAYLNNPRPVYPPLSRRLGETGTVWLRVRVEADGRAGQVDIARSSGYPRLDQAALQAVMAWTFVPARRGEQAIAAWVRVPIEFKQ